MKIQIFKKMNLKKLEKIKMVTKNELIRALKLKAKQKIGDISNRNTYSEYNNKYKKEYEKLKIEFDKKYPNGKFEYKKGHFAKVYLNYNFNCGGNGIDNFQPSKELEKINEEYNKISKFETKYEIQKKCDEIESKILLMGATKEMIDLINSF